MRNGICALLLCLALLFAPWHGDALACRKTWWGVLDPSALDMARADDPAWPEEEGEVTFVWPWWEWLRDALRV